MRSIRYRFCASGARYRRSLSPTAHLANELPKLGDASTAIIGRILLLLTTRSWLGKEDHDLEPALQAEMTGILNWSLDGLARLTDNGGRFTRILKLAREAQV